MLESNFQWLQISENLLSRFAQVCSRGNAAHLSESTVGSLETQLTIQDGKADGGRIEESCQQLLRLTKSLGCEPPAGKISRDFHFESQGGRHFTPDYLLSGRCGAILPVRCCLGAIHFVRYCNVECGRGGAVY